MTRRPRDPDPNHRRIQRSRNDTNTREPLEAQALEAQRSSGFHRGGVAGRCCGPAASAKNAGADQRLTRQPLARRRTKLPDRRELFEGVGAENRVTLCDLLVLGDESTEAIAPKNVRTTVGY